MRNRLKHPPMLLLTILFTAILIWTAYVGSAALNAAIVSKSNTAGPNTRHIGLGAWTMGLYDPSSGTLNPNALLDYQNMTQKPVQYAHYYLGWDALATPAVLNQVSVLHSHGWTPVISTNPYYFSGCPVTSLPLYRAIATGQCDTFLHSAGSNLARLNQPIYLVFAYEMNNPVNAWSLAKTGSTPTDFVAAWRHIYTTFQKQGASNVIWVFDPNVPDTTATPDNQLYPGSNYVDWLGLDGYNWGATQTWSSWTSFSGVFGGSYKTLTTIAPNKPMMIAEVNSTNLGGDKAAWYIDMLTRAVPYDFPDIKILMIYNEDRTSQENVNWDVNVTSESLKAYMQGVHSKFY